MGVNSLEVIGWKISSYLPRSQVYALTCTEGLTSDIRVIIHSSNGHSVIGVNGLKVIG